MTTDRPTTDAAMTTPAQHTPEPWTVQQLDTQRHGYDWSTYAVRSPQNVCLAVVGEIDRYESERIPANARLIAAAPELLAVLTLALRYLEHPDVVALPFALASSCAADRARAAIRRATESGS